jgi:LysM repeat protein
MNNPSPLIPQGSMFEQKSKSRARVKVAFFCVVGVHVAAIVVALLAQGCKREPQTTTTDNGQPVVPEATNSLPVFDTNVAAAAPTNYVPPPLPDVAPPPATATEYVIQRGDTFSSIAPKFHVTVKALQTANPNVDPAKLQIGQKIMIPPPTVAAPGTSTATPTVAPTGEQLYTVKSGDALIKIAAEHHTTVNAIKRLNNLSTDRIVVGQKLKLPPNTAPAPTEPAPTPAPVPQ